MKQRSVQLDVKIAHLNRNYKFSRNQNYCHQDNAFNEPIQKKRIRFMHKIWIRLYLCIEYTEAVYSILCVQGKICFIRKTKSMLCSMKLIVKNKICFMEKIRICLNAI
jgi:predicted small integral membrane protein